LDEAKQAKKIRTVGQESEYELVNHILPTSAAVERLVSRAKLINTKHRKTISAAHLDAVLSLRCNRSRWNKETIEFCIREQEKAPPREEEKEEEMDEVTRLLLDYEDIGELRDESEGEESEGEEGEFDREVTGGTRLP
jgi:hypothetical protein